MGPRVGFGGFWGLGGPWALGTLGPWRPGPRVPQGPTSPWGENRGIGEPRNFSRTEEMENLLVGEPRKWRTVDRKRIDARVGAPNQRTDHIAVVDLE